MAGIGSKSMNRAVLGLSPKTVIGSAPSSQCGMAFVTLIAGLLPVSGWCQDSLRHSLAGDSAYEANKIGIESLPYTYKSGDFRLLLTPSLSLQYNDNVGLGAASSSSDFILSPLMGVTMSYPLSERNLFSLNVTAGYDHYLKSSQYDAAHIESGSALSFDVYVKDLKINLHDSFSLTEHSSAEGAVGGTPFYGQFMNSVGQSTMWDLEDLTLTFGYDHVNTISPSSQFKYLDSSSEMPIIRAGFRFDPRLTVGLEGSASFMSYDYAVLNNHSSYSGGLYADWTPDSFFHIQPRAGYTVSEFQHTSVSYEIIQIAGLGAPIAIPVGETIQTKGTPSYYVGFTLTHQVMAAVSYGVSAGHETRVGIQSDETEVWYFRPNITWQPRKDLSISTTFFYEHGNTGVGNVSGNLVETYDYYGGGFSVSHELLKRLTGSLNYSLTFRSSNGPEGGYTQNLVMLRLSYQL
jgi:hypothetical protein